MSRNASTCVGIMSFVLLACVSSLAFSPKPGETDPCDIICPDGLSYLGKTFRINGCVSASVCPLPGCTETSCFPIGTCPGCQGDNAEEAAGTCGDSLHYQPSAFCTQSETFVDPVIGEWGSASGRSHILGDYDIVANHNEIQVTMNTTARMQGQADVNCTKVPTGCTSVLCRVEAHDIKAIVPFHTCQDLIISIDAGLAVSQFVDIPGNVTASVSLNGNGICGFSSSGGSCSVTLTIPAGDHELVVVYDTGTIGEDVVAQCPGNGSNSGLGTLAHAVLVELTVIGEP